MKPAISQKDKEMISGWIVALWFYTSTREDIPTGPDLIRMSMDDLQEEQMEVFRNAAQEVGTGLLRGAEKATANLMVQMPSAVPPEEQQKELLKQMACYLGMETVYDSIGGHVTDTVGKILSGMMVAALWSDIEPTEDVLGAIWLEGVGISLTAAPAWEQAKDTEVGERVTALVESRFLVLDPPTKGKYTVQFPT